MTTNKNMYFTMLLKAQFEAKKQKALATLNNLFN